MRKSMVDAIVGTMRDLNKSGVVDDITLRNIEKLCVPDVHDYTPEDIAALRKQLSLSQGALAKIFNISLSTVQKWEQGLKKPAGAAKKLLDIMERKGLEAFV
jgi:putative transcriptional regulator